MQEWKKPPLLSDLHQHRQLRPGAPQLLPLGEEVPAGRTGAEGEGEAGAGEVGAAGEEQLGVRQQEVHL